MTNEKHEDGGPAFPTGHEDAYGFMSDGMTLREYAAIHLRVPNSGKAWLDEMIEVANRNDVAATALNGIIASPHSFENVERNGKANSISEMVKVAVAFADVMLAERRKRKG